MEVVVDACIIGETSLREVLQDSKVAYVESAELAGFEAFNFRVYFTGNCKE